MTQANEPITACISELDYGGLTKREYFAAMAMQGMLANNTGRDINTISAFAVISADVLIAELNK